MGLWNPPVGMQDAERLQITIRIAFTRNGTLAAPPIVLTSGNGVRFNAMRDSAVRAVLVGQPYHDAAAGSLRELEGNRLHLRSVREMYKDIPATMNSADRIPSLPPAQPPPPARRRRRARFDRRAAGRRRASASTSTQGNLQPMPIALPDFVAGGAGRRRNRAQRHRTSSPTICSAAACSRRSTRRPSPSSITNGDAVPRFPDWRVINAQALVTGRITRQGDGRLQGANSGCGTCSPASSSTASSISPRPTIGGASPTSSPTQIYETLTGEKGYFDSRIVFVDETGPKDRRVKRLAIMDQDGFGVRYLTRGDELVLTPRFNPSTQEITYMSYGQGEPRVYLLNIETGQREIVGNFPGMTFAPRFSPDGQRVIMSLQQGGNANLFVMDLRSKQTTRLTDTPAIDTAPCYLARRQPDRVRERPRRLAADLRDGGERRGGAAHQLRRGALFDAGLVAARRLHRLHRPRSAAASPSACIKPDGSGERILTEGFHNEGPTFAPNGRVLMFFRDPGQPGRRSIRSTSPAAMSCKQPTPSYASDPAWSPLLS